MENKRYPNLMPAPTPDGSQTLCGMFDQLATRKDFLDLRPLMDDKTPLKNPHKGWFWHYIDNGYGRGNYREAHDHNDALLDFPGLNHLYLRFDWGDVEKAEGVYDFSYLDEIMDLWAPRGYKFSLRVCSYENDPNMNHATPAYVYEQGAKGYRLPGGRIQPDYGDPIFLHHVERLLYTLGEKFNGHPLIECIDVGTMGTWGEGHTACGTGEIIPPPVVKKHFDLHAKYFPDTWVLCNDDHFSCRIAHGQAEVQEILDYAYERGFGVQDDSVCCNYYTQVNDYDTLRAPWAFDKLWKNAPTAIEMEHYGFVHAHNDHFRDGLTAIEAFKRCHATFTGFHGYPRAWLNNEYYLTEYCANRLGYWYFVTGMTLPTLTPTAHNMITLDVENRGWAKAYHKYDLVFRFRSMAGKDYIIPVECDNRKWMPGVKQTLKLQLDLRHIPAGKYEVAIGMFEGETPVKLALKESVSDGKFYTLCGATVKGI